MIVILFASWIPIFPVSGMRDILLEGNRWEVAQILPALPHQN